MAKRNVEVLKDKSGNEICVTYSYSLTPAGVLPPVLLHSVVTIIAGAGVEIEPLLNKDQQEKIINQLSIK